MTGGIDFLYIALVLGSILISITFHEAMHAWTGYKLGDRTAHEEGRITLNPLRHIDPFTTVLLPLILMLLGAAPFLIAKPVPFNPSRVKYDEWGAALIAAAGPFTNLGLAIIAGLLVRLFGLGSGEFIGYALLVFIQVNVATFVFNLIPFPPLDGSRVLYAIAPDPVRNLMNTIEGFGLGGILLFMFFIFRFLSPVVSEITQRIYYFLV